MVPLSANIDLIRDKGMVLGFKGVNVIGVQIDC